MTDAGMFTSIWQFYHPGGGADRNSWAFLSVSTTAVVIGALLGVPLGAILGLRKFRAGSFDATTYTLMSLPPVLAGLLVYLLFARSGPMGFLDILFTPSVMVIAQVLLVTPIITGLAAAAIAAKEKLSMDTARTLGASERQAAWVVIKEARTGILAGVMTGFGRAFGEVGAVMMVGGNVRYQTRVLTTSIVLETFRAI